MRDDLPGSVPRHVPCCGQPTLLRSLLDAYAEPVVVGCHMLNLQARSRLHSMGENVPASSARWCLRGNLDSATVSNADGSGVAFRYRDPKLFRDLSRRAVRNYRKLAQDWPRLKEAYRAAVPELTSVESWRKVFEN